MKKPVLVKEHRTEGWIYVCPHCKHYICSEKEICNNCEGEIDWSKQETYRGRAVFDGK